MVRPKEPRASERPPPPGEALYCLRPLGPSRSALLPRLRPKVMCTARRAWFYDPFNALPDPPSPPYPRRPHHGSAAVRPAQEHPAALLVRSSGPVLRHNHAAPAPPPPTYPFNRVLLPVLYVSFAACSLPCFPVPAAHTPRNVPPHARPRRLAVHPPASFALSHLHAVLSSLRPARPPSFPPYIPRVSCALSALGSSTRSEQFCGMLSAGRVCRYSALHS